MNDAELEAARARIFGEGWPLREAVASPTRERKLADTFDLGLREATRSGRTIQGVSVHGAVSQNGRRYTREAREDIVNLIKEGRNQVFANHPEGNRNPVRPVEALVGVLKRPRLSGDRIRADLQVVDAEPWRSLLPSIAEEMPEAAGLSIRGKGSVREAEDGTFVVESVDHLFGTELVTEPATVDALVESLQGGRAVTRPGRGGQRGFRPVTDDVLERASWGLIN